VIRENNTRGDTVESEIFAVTAVQHSRNWAEALLI